MQSVVTEVAVVLLPDTWKEQAVLPVCKNLIISKFFIRRQTLWNWSFSILLLALLTELFSGSNSKIQFAMYHLLLTPQHLLDIEHNNIIPMFMSSHGIASSLKWYYVHIFCLIGMFFFSSNNVQSLLLGLKSS